MQINVISLVLGVLSVYTLAVSASPVPPMAQGLAPASSGNTDDAMWYDRDLESVVDKVHQMEATSRDVDETWRSSRLQDILTELGYPPLTTLIDSDSLFHELEVVAAECDGMDDKQAMICSVLLDDAVFGLKVSDAQEQDNTDEMNRAGLSAYQRLDKALLKLSQLSGKQRTEIKRHVAWILEVKLDYQPRRTWANLSLKQILSFLSDDVYNSGDLALIPRMIRFKDAREVADAVLGPQDVN